LLAYVFSHRPADAVDEATYEEALHQFHAALASSRPAGFVASTTYRHGEGYSDWYLVEDSAALDVLNDAAVSGTRSASHDAAARMAASGSGKLYRLVHGEADAETPHEIAFSKPAGMSYSDLYHRLEAFSARPGTALWRRMMVLGPPPEFCLVAREPVELPGEFRPEPRTRRQI